MKTSRIKIHSLLLATVAFLLILNLFVVREMDSFGIPILFAFAILFEILLVILFLYELLMVLKHPLKILISIMLSGFKGVLKDPYILNFQEKYPHFTSRLKKFFSKEKPIGLILGIGFLTAFLFFILFLNIASIVFAKNSSTILDERILTLIPNIRTPDQTDFFSVITFLMNWQSVLFISLFILIFLFYKKQRFTAFLFTSLILLTGFLNFVFKHLFCRLRPDKTLNLISENTYSFPSEHALFATVIFGVWAYFFTRLSRHPLLKFFIFLFTILAITLVSLSRIYMGVHYPTDLLASIILGFSLLTVFITLAEIERKYSFFETSKLKFLTFFTDAKDHHLEGLILSPFLLILFSLLFHSYFIHLHQIKPYLSSQVIQELNSDIINQITKNTQSLTGQNIEPVSFIFIAHQNELENIFQQKGWFKADEATLSNGLRALSAAFKNEAYQTGTVTPAYFEGMPQTFAFQHSDKLGTFRQRHHIRLWKTEYKLPDGRFIWVATASFDKGFKFNEFLIITHKIDPNIDAERSYILQSLNLKEIKYIQMVKPELGVNAFGDQFFTDGKAAIVDFSLKE